MKKIFLEDLNLVKGETVNVDGKNFHHLSNVLRVQKGEKFIIGGKDDLEFYGIITGISKKSIEFCLEEEYVRPDILIPESTLFFSILKGDKNEEIIKKCTEIGIDKFIPVASKNCIIKYDEVTAQKKMEKWLTVSKESSMQCGRHKAAEIFPITRFDNIENYAINSLKIFGNIAEDSKPLMTILKNHEKADKISIMIGPEGDFTRPEKDFLFKSGWIGAGLGPNILKSDTAAIYMCSSVFCFYGEGKDV
jgi:16S rRNA (uracil1498-N3)-methyltransferase